MNHHSKGFFIIKRLFSRRSDVSRVAGVRHSSVVKDTFTRLAVVTLMIALTFPFLQVTKSSAQNNLYFWQVRTMESDETGLASPVGLAFSNRDDAFHMVGREQSSRASTDLVKLTSLVERAGSVRIAPGLQNPINMAYDNHMDRLLFLNAPANQLWVVQADINGNLNPADAVRYDVRGLGLQNPQGMAVDEATGTLFILDAATPLIRQLTSLPDGSFDTANISEINLQPHGFSAVRGLAFDQGSGHLFVINPLEHQLYELTQSGELIATRDLAPFRLQDPQAMVFARSGDQTDDPAELSLYVTDSGSSEQPSSNLATVTEGSGRVVEFSLAALAEPSAASFSSSLIRITNMGAISPPSPDPSGIAYLPGRNSLLIVDGEVEETVNGISHFQGANVWELTLSGSKIRTANISKKAPTVVPMTNEPTDITWDPNNGHYYVVDDNAKRVFDLNPGADGLIGTADDKWTYFSTSGVGSGDPEGITFNTWNNHIFVADGTNAEVYEFTTTGTLVNHFDVKQYGVIDPEGIEFNPERGTLFTMSSRKSTPIIVETTIGGELLQTINISVTNSQVAAGLAYGPASNGSGENRFYIVDRGIDNNVDPTIIDGRVYEITAPGSGPAVTPSMTFTPASSPTRTPTPAATFTSTATGAVSPSPTWTATRTNTPTPTRTSTAGPTFTSTATFTPVPTSAGSDLIFANGFESGNFSAWSASVTNSGNLSVSQNAALSGSYGLQARFSNTTSMYVRDDSPAAEPRYRVRFYFNPNSISMASGDYAYLLQGHDVSNKVILFIQFYRNSAGYQVRVRAHDSVLANYVNTPYIAITNAVHSLEVDWANNGNVTFWVDGIQKASLTGLNNSAYGMQSVRLGAPYISAAGMSGTYYIDAFESRRQNYIGP
jgi:uncharacterized protein YjiK